MPVKLRGWDEERRCLGGPQGTRKGVGHYRVLVQKAGSE